MPLLARLVLIFLCFPSFVFGSTSISGSFKATQDCPAYVSKNKRSNPDGLHLKLGAVYPLVEANRPNRPDWYRLRLQAEPALRWVSKDCGEVRQGSADPDPSADSNPTGNSCNTAGLQDSFVLALSWQPAFCETKPNKPECQIDDQQSFQASHFTLHGLWPNKKSCGTSYGYCGDVRKKPDGFCNYPVLSLEQQTRNQLEVVMPSAAAGSCLQRHEWFKHGTCQGQWTQTDYYNVAVKLTHEFNQTGVSDFMRRHTGKTVSEKEFKEMIAQVHGGYVHRALQLKCKNNNLVDLYIHLPAPLSSDKPLAELMRQGGKGYQSNCRGKFKVDPIGFQ